MHSLLMTIVILLSVVYSSVSIRFHIVLSLQTSQCPGELAGEPCLTLEQYVSYPSQSNYVTLQFEPGNHTLKSQLSISSKSYFGIVALGNATIDCNGLSATSVTFSGVNQVDIGGITFIRCGTVQLSSITSGSIERSTFLQTVGSYALYITSSQVTIESCTFANNTRSSVYLEFTTATIMSSNFRDNFVTSNNGGAIYSRYRSLTITRSSFKNNTARDDGGAVYFTAPSYILTVKQCIFDSNNANSGEGGAVYVSGNYGSATDTNTGNIYKHNRASLYGGALYVSQNVYMNGSNFTNNSASTGGAVYTSGSYVSIISSASAFVNNTASSSGGAIHVNGQYGSIVANKTIFINNQAISGAGGAIYVPGIRASITTYNTTFTNNEGYTGGGALYISNSQTSLTVNQSTFVNNLITGPDGNGGAVNVNNANTRLIVFNGSIFVNNSATNGTGGAIYAKRGFSVTDTIFGYNKAPLCAALNVDQSNSDRSMSLTTSTFLYNSASGSTVRGNIGGVGCIRNADVSILGSTFSHNTAAGSGGVFALEDSIIYIERNTFKNNSATVDGGVFYTGVFPSNYTVTQSTFTNNRAGDDGGVIYVGRNGSFIDVGLSSFSQNTATDRGGIIAIFGSSVSVTTTNMQSNMASLGDDLSVCSSDSTNSIPSLNVQTDPMYSVCTLYDGSVQGNPEPMTHDNSNFDFTAYFQTFIVVSGEPTTTTTEAIVTTIYVDPLLKEIQSRLFGTSVIIYLLFAFAIIFVAVLIIVVTVKWYKNRKTKAQLSHESTVTKKGNAKYEYNVDDIEVYEEPDRSIQHSNSIQLRQNVGYSQQPHYE